LKGAIMLRKIIPKDILNGVAASLDKTIRLQQGL
jgi:hypothetical protein